MSLAKALLDFQRKAPAIQKDKINPHFRSSYPSLHSLSEAVLPVANECGLVITQMPTTTLDGLPALRTRITHAESGESFEDVMLLMAAKSDPQGQGSAITYARRYALMAALGLVADEDDDGNAASGRKSAGDPRGSHAAATAPSAAESNVSADASAASPAESPFRAPERKPPEDDGKPANVVVPVGKHKGQTVGELPPAYRKWVIANFEAKNAEQNRYLEAVKLVEGVSTLVPDDDIPF